MAFHPEKGWAITIADAAAAVLPDTPLDIRARSVGATFYDTQGHVMYPMLPSSISEDTASLLPGCARLGITLMVQTGEFVASIITVAESYTYETIEGHPLLEGKEPHAWIEHAMIQYNTAVARLLRSTSRGILRTQSPGDAADLAHWESIDPMLRFLAMESATYTHADPSIDQSHASLGIDAYCHASSPLRRYADLINQRCLHSILGMNEYGHETDDTLPDHLNLRMKENRRFSRDILFLENVIPGRIHHIQVRWLSDTQVWVPEWKRILRIRHTPTEKGSHIAIFCDPSKRNWKQRILTAEP
jgi:exoribonuclease R